MRGKAASRSGSQEIDDGVRQTRIGESLDTILRDVRHGCRALWRSPGFALVVILTLMVGIGANVTIFSVLRSVLWRPLPYRDADRIVTLIVDARGVPNAGAAQGEILDVREQSRLVDHISTIIGVDAHVDVDGDVDRVAAASVTDDVLPLLGATPLVLGRALNAAQDDRASGMRVVISHELWRGKFGGDPAIIGRRAQINNRQMEIIGVLRPGLRVFLPSSTNTAEQIDVWFPMNIGGSRDSRGLAVLGRLKPNVSLQQAQAEFDTFAARFVRQYPTAYSAGALRLTLKPLREAITENVRPILVALTGAVGFVLLIACANVANLMLARNKARETELAVRRALGASTARLTFQLLAESFLLAALGGGAGLLVGYLGLGLIDWLRPVNLPRQSDISMDRTVVIFTIGLSILTSLVFGLLPALRHALDRHSHVLTSARSQVSARGTRRLQGALVVSEVAVSIIPLVAAGLMLQTFVNLLRAPIGFDPANLQTAKISLSLRQYPDIASRWAFYRDLLDRVGQLPGVERVTAASPLPFAPRQDRRRYGRDGDEATPFSLATQQTVMPGYVPLTQTGLREGRDFTVQDIDTQQPVVIVDERIAKQLWPAGALGQQLLVQSGARRRVLEVIGVTNAVRATEVRDDQTPHFFVPYHVNPVEMSLVVKTSLNSDALRPAIERTVATLGTGRAVFDVRSMGNYAADSISGTRFTMLLLVGFAGAALSLAALGLYGTLTYLISQRTREFGVRVALGASAWQIMGAVVQEGMTMSAIGAGIGVFGAFAVTRTLQGLLYHVRPFDSLTLLGVAALVLLVAMLAASRPAWRAARVDPSLALRVE